MGVRKGDTVAIISRNRLEWILAAYASYGLGAIIVPMYENQKESDWRYIVADSKAKVLIASTTAIYDKVRSNTLAAASAAIKRTCGVFFASTVNLRCFFFSGQSFRFRGRRATRAGMRPSGFAPG